LPDELDAHDAFDIDPATHPYDDLLLECPDFASNLYLTGDAKLTQQELNKQKTRERNARWQARADELHELHKKDVPRKSKKWIAEHIAKEPIAEGRDAETIRKKITINRHGK
jgi:hypothetical protein